VAAFAASTTGGRMRALAKLLLLVGTMTAVPAAPVAANREIDMAGFLSLATAAAEHRESRRVDQATFVRMMREPGTIVLDARSRPMYERRHVEGAVSLSLPDFTAATLAAAIPDPGARVLIYCNNNFANDPIPFPLKVAQASLNLSTYVALYTYGYRNVYELEPYVDVKLTPIPLVPRP
jgi:hypothetical protein